MKSLMPAPRSRTILPVFAAVLILCAIIFALEYPAPFRFADFILLWSAGHQLVRFRNPYDPFTILFLERLIGWHGPVALMYSPPSCLFLALPFGFFDEFVGSMIWLSASLAALICSVQTLWIMHGRRKGIIHLFGYLFPPAITCLLVGQTATFILLGVVLFLYCYKKFPWIAGMGIFLCLLKPHLFIPFGCVLILWSIRQREYRIIAGGLGLFVASSLFAVYIDAHCWSEYFAMMRSGRLETILIPTMGVLLRRIIDLRIFALGFVPATIGSVWGVWYFLKNREQWDWNRHGMVLLLVSVWVAPYAWFTDETVLFPAILAGLYCLSEKRRSLIPYVLIAGVAFAEVSAGIILQSWWYIWTPVAWLAWYLYSEHRVSKVVQTAVTA